MAALPIIEWAYALAEKLDRNIMLRLVKGAYWDTEIKRAQVLGLSNFPVLTRKKFNRSFLPRLRQKTLRTQ